MGSGSAGQCALLQPGPQCRCMQSRSAWAPTPGTPDRLPLVTQTQVRNEKARRFLQNMRKKAGVPFEQYFPRADRGALALLRRLLAFDPADRPTAEEALADPYFAGVCVRASNAEASTQNAHQRAHMHCDMQGICMRGLDLLRRAKLCRAWVGIALLVMQYVVDRTSRSTYN